MSLESTKREPVFHHASETWNRFWFTPVDTSQLYVLRIAVGLLSLYFLLSFNADIVSWFGPQGMLPVEVVGQLTGSDTSSDLGGFHFSYFSSLTSATELWLVHMIGIVVVLFFTLGLYTRVSSILSFVVFLAYVHRGPMITGPLEPVLGMLLLYLCLAPAGRCLSLDMWRIKSLFTNDVKRPSVAANISLRLIQLHLSGFYLTMGLTKLGGETWWTGQAVWWLIAHPESRLVDLTFLHRFEYLLNAWTHTIVLFEVTYGILIWNRSFRPFLLWISLFHWLGLAVVTGLVPFCTVMLVANTVWISSDFFDNFLSRWMNRPILPSSNPASS